MSASAQPTDVLPVDNFSAGIVAAAAREFPAPVATEDESAALAQCLSVAATTTGTS